MGSEGLPRLLLTIPLGPSQVPLSGTVTKFLTPQHEVWQVLARSDSSLDTIATLLAILVLDDAETIMPVQMMPAHPSTAVLRTDGQIRQGRGLFLAPWALAEIKRLADCLTNDHQAYLADVSAALKQEAKGDFKPVPSDFILTDLAGSARLGPPPPGLDPDLSKSERVRFKLNSYQVVAQDYARNRYLVLLSDDQIARRTEAIVGNMHVIDEQGLVSPDRTDPSLYYWLSRLTEVQAEMVLRHGPYPAGWHPGMIDFNNMPTSLRRAGPDAARSLRSARGLPASYLVKYGQRGHLEQALREGRLRIAPASSYDDPSLNPAMQDDEMEAAIQYDPSIPFNDAPPGTILLPYGRVPLRQRLNTDYHVYCLATEVSMRLLFDFERDACLIIHDPDAFTARVHAGVRERLPGWHPLAGRVEYYDPLQVSPAEIQLPMWKNFRFAYQKEMRLAWLPPNPVRELEPLFVTIGDLTDIAELVLPTQS